MTKITNKPTLLYNGTVAITFQPGAHRYTIDGSPKIGVTTILRVINKPELRLWPLNMAMTALEKNWHIDHPYTAIERQIVLDQAYAAHSDKSTRGKDVGSLVHSYIEYYFDDDVDETVYLQDIQQTADGLAVSGGVHAFHSFLEVFEPEIIHVERVVYSKMHDYPGTLDMVAKIKTKQGPKTYLIDFKTTNKSKSAPDGIYPEAFLQVGAYDIALTEETGIKIDEHMIVNLDKVSGKYHIRTMNAKIGKNGFLAALALYKSQKLIKEILNDHPNAAYAAKVGTRSS